uniref:Minor tail T domain-containing protein n=1 Tax=viral metagenome TaxID=1070528 RepID=A0A6M3LDF0_9ZZZZ
MALGEAQPRRLLDKLTSNEWSEWLAYWSVEPWGEERADFRSGMLAAALSNRWRGKGERAAKPQDFMPFTDEPEQTPEYIRQRMTDILNNASNSKT